jgi:hypothetical protein
MRFGGGSIGEWREDGDVGGAITSLNFEVIFRDDDVVAVRGTGDLPAVEAVA